MKVPSTELWSPHSHKSVTTHTCSLPAPHKQQEKGKEEEEEEGEEKEEK